MVNAHFFKPQKPKQMKTRDEILEIIKNYEQELRETMQENIDAFGYLDADTQRATERWLVMEELLTRLNLNDEK